MVVGLNCPWFCTGNDTKQAYAQVDELAPRVIRDPGLKQARWDHAASKGIFMMPLLESPNISALSWAVKHPAFCGVVELSNEPFWNGISAQSWVNTWGPVIDQIKAQYPGVKMLAPVDDWPSARSSGPGTAVWVQQLLAARPALRGMFGWAIHPYFDGDPKQALQHLQNGIAALKANGVPNPRIFCTEWGWSRFNTTEANQAAYATLFLNGLPPEAAAVFWYQINDTLRQGASGWNRDAGFGLLKEPASANWDDGWAKASVWQTMKNAVLASPPGDFNTQTATVTVSLDGTSKSVPITVGSAPLQTVTNQEVTSEQPSMSEVRALPDMRTQRPLRPSLLVGSPPVDVPDLPVPVDSDHLAQHHGLDGPRVNQDRPDVLLGGTVKALGSFFSRYAKACIPVILSAAVVAQRWIETGHVDRVAAGAVAYGAIAAIAVALTSNASNPANNNPIPPAV